MPRTEGADESGRPGDQPTTRSTPMSPKSVVDQVTLSPKPDLHPCLVNTLEPPAPVTDPADVDTIDQPLLTHQTREHERGRGCVSVVQDVQNNSRRDHYHNEQPEARQHLAGRAIEAIPRWPAPVPSSCELLLLRGCQVGDRREDEARDGPREPSGEVQNVTEQISLRNGGSKTCQRSETFFPSVP